MAFTDATEYPVGFNDTLTLSITARTIGVANQAVKVSHFILKCGGTPRRVTFRQTDNTVYFQINLGANELLVINRGFNATGGLEILTDDAATDVKLLIHFFNG